MTTPSSENRTDRTEPRGLDVDLDAPLTKPAGYYEDEDFRPDALAMYGTLDTSDTGGGAHQDIRETSPVFTEARAMNLVTAARALDPTDETVPPELVTLPEGSVTVTGTAKTAEQARLDVENALKRMAENPVGVGGAGPNAQAAEHSTAEEDEAERQSETRARRTDKDADGDGVPDRKDPDADGDGVPDRKEPTSAPRVGGGATNRRGTTSK